MNTEVVDIRGHAAPGFEAMRTGVAEALDDGRGGGGGFAATLDGELIVDLHGGWADGDQTQTFGAATLTRVFSSSKAISSLVVAMLVDHGALSYDQRMTDLWPEFGQAGKDAVTLEQALSHQAGVPGFLSDWAAEDWLDWDKTCARVARQEPMWEPGSASGYHPITWGHLAGETVRRADGRTLGTILREDICAPHGLDFHIGLPDAEHGRVAGLSAPRSIPEFGDVNDATRAAFLLPWSSPPRRDSAAVRRIELPSANGHGTAAAMARLMEPFARGGRLGDTQLVAPETVTAATAERISGQDLVLPYDLSFGAGLIRNRPGAPVYGPGEHTVGHAGYGGSFVMADPDRGLTAAFAPTALNPTLSSDARLQNLIAALYGCL